MLPGRLKACAVAVLLTAMPGAMVGCTPPASAGGFDGPDPASKMYATVRAGEARDREAIPHLIELLDHDDPAVRMLAIGALDRITGRRLGYNPYAPDAAREPAVRRWVAAYRDGELDRPAPEPAASTADASDP